jgi:hypothetical protein
MTESNIYEAQFVKAFLNKQQEVRPTQEEVWPARRHETRDSAAQHHRHGNDGRDRFRVPKGQLYIHHLAIPHHQGGRPKDPRAA